MPTATKGEASVLIDASPRAVYDLVTDITLRDTLAAIKRAAELAPASQRG